MFTIFCSKIHTSKIILGNRSFSACPKVNTEINLMARSPLDYALPK